MYTDGDHFLDRSCPTETSRLIRTCLEVGIGDGGGESVDDPGGGLGAAKKVL